jgi:hypothetical protein
MSATPLSLVARQASLTGIRNALDAGGGRALCYSGLPPANPADTPDGALLGTVLLASTSGAVGASGALATLTLTVPRTALAAASGEIGFIRLADGSSAGFLDAPVGVEGSDAPAIVNVTQVFAGGEIQLLSFVIAL